MKTSLKTKLALLSLVSIVTVSSVMALDVADYAGGAASVSKTGNETMINHAAGQKIFNNNWNQFNLKSSETANFKFNGHNQVSINRVIGNDMSQIYGTIKSTGTGASTSHIILSNPNGLIFGAGSLVNVNAFTATTHDVNATETCDGVKVELTNAKNGKITLDGATFAVSKSAAIIAKDIDVKDSYVFTKTGSNAVDYKGSLLSTEDMKQFQSIGSDNEAVHSNVKIISNDGVNFELKQKEAGAIHNGTVGKLDGKNAHSINISNSQIASGSVEMYAGGNKNSNITIKDTAVKGVKLVNFAYGDIALVSKGKVNISSSSLETKGSYAMKEDGTLINNTFDAKHSISKTGGTISIKGDEGVEINNSSIKTVASNYNDTKASMEDPTFAKYAANGSQHGGVQIVSQNGGIKIANSDISSKGSVYMYAKGDVDIDSSAVKAAGTQSKIEGVTEGFGNDKLIYVRGKNVNSKNSNIKADGQIALYADNGDINVKNDKTNTIEAKAIQMIAKGDITTTQTVLKADKTVLTAGSNITLDKTSAKAYTDGTIARVEMTAKEGSVKTADNSFLKMNGNKLVVRANKGDIKMNLVAANNQKAGVEAYAGNNTTLSASDVNGNTQNAELSIARIETNTLNLKADNKFIADNNAETAVDGRAYINVRTYGGFNFDSKPEYVGKNTQNVQYESYRNAVKDENGKTVVYDRHSMTLKDNAQFTLDYRKPVEIKDTPVKPDEPTIQGDGYQDLTKLPLQAANPTLASSITNNMTDPTSGMIAAAAAIEIDEDEQLDY